MTYDPNNIFARILRGEIPCKKVYEDAHVLATSTAGVASNGANQIKGFVWPNPVQLVSGSEVQGNVLLAGKLHYDDIPLPAGETQSVLDAALQTNCRSLGLIVQGLGKVR